MFAQPLLKEPGAKGECRLATLLRTEAVRAGELGHDQKLRGHAEESPRRQRDRRTRTRSNGVKTKMKHEMEREGEKLNSLCASKQIPIN